MLQNTVQQVIDGNEYHEAEHQGQPDSETVFLSPFTHWLTTHRFDAIEHQMAAVENRDREKVNQAKRYRE